MTAVKWSRSKNGEWRMKWKVGRLLINKFSCDSNGKKRSGKEMRECAAEKERCSALRLCFSVEFVCWLRALKERLLASLVATTGKCWSSGRVERNWWNWFISCVNFLHDLLVAARRICWVVSGIFECRQQGLLVCCLLSLAEWRKCLAVLHKLTLNCNWTADFGLLLMTSGMLHSHTGIVWGG